ncbi:MAG: antitoxin family protein [Pirellulaceae bacterium]|nr:antitoxin family protein [Pirellulaceae bacterium]
MSTVEAIFEGGVFRPLAAVSIPESQRVRLTIEPAGSGEIAAWLQAADKLQVEIIARSGILPDSTPEIAKDRLGHE